MTRVLGSLALVVGGVAWVAFALIGAAILLFFFNTEDDRALLAIAPGLAWSTLGARSLMSAARRSSVPTPA